MFLTLTPSLLHKIIRQTAYFTIHYRLLPILYPRRCPVCHRVMPLGSFICPSCRQTLPFVHEPVCYRCGKPIASREQEYCHDCRLFKKSFYRGVSLFIYNERTRPFMSAFKYNNRRCLAHFFAREIFYIHKSTLSHWNIDAVIPVPLHKNKRKKRGYNQAELLSEALALLLNLPCYKHILLRTTDTLPQKQFSPQARLNNLQNAFALNPKYTNKLSSISTVLLVDDIYTTGATMEICSRVLLSSGIKRVCVCSVCTGISVN